VREDGTLYPGAFLVLRIAAAVLLVLACLQLGRNGRLSAFGDRASGQVVEVVSRSPVVEFKTAAGRAVRFKSAAVRRPTPFHAGDAVNVLYLPDTPEKAEIDDPRYLWLPGGMALFVGGVLLAVSVVGRPRR
jgi:hypothetical protein